MTDTKSAEGLIAAWDEAVAAWQGSYDSDLEDVDRMSAAGNAIADALEAARTKIAELEKGDVHAMCWKRATHQVERIAELELAKKVYGVPCNVEEAFEDFGIFRGYGIEHGDLVLMSAVHKDRSVSATMLAAALRAALPGRERGR